MTKRNIVILIIILSLIISIFSINNYQKKENLKKTWLNNEKAISDINSEFKIINISIFETTYEELIKIMGKPININLIQDRNIITNFGYFSVLSYKDIEFTINTNNNYELTKGLVTEIDITGSNISTTKGITINDNKEKIKTTYSIEKFYSLENSSEYPLDTNRIKGLKRGEKEIKINEYDEYCYIQSKNRPIAIIFLLKDNTVKRIVFRHLTAG